MKWINANVDQVPEDGQQVLISVNGIYYDAVYNAKHQEFVTVKFQHVIFNMRKHNIYWCPIVPPEK